jgi:hypothetical protein
MYVICASLELSDSAVAFLLLFQVLCVMNI